MIPDTTVKAEWGEEHVAETHCPSCGAVLTPDGPDGGEIEYTAVQLVRRIGEMMGDDHVATNSLFMRACTEMTDDEIGMKLGMTRQAISQREQKLARKYPMLKRLLIDMRRREAARRAAAERAERKIAKRAMGSLTNGAPMRRKQRRAT